LTLASGPETIQFVNHRLPKLDQRPPSGKAPLLGPVNQFFGFIPNQMAPCAGSISSTANRQRPDCPRLASFRTPPLAGGGAFVRQPRSKLVDHSSFRGEVETCRTSASTRRCWQAHNDSRASAAGRSRAFGGGSRGDGSSKVCWALFTCSQNQPEPRVRRRATP